ncbi:helix-turn-helix transcriptional regulator [Streptomyces sp. P9(2023)]|nr:helix-turn-helix transcriptional regulator [Streptomyces sp. P9(2023)]
MAEEAFIRQVRKIRVALDMSQVELAERVMALGGSMYQQTIAKLESGQRSLKLSEADLLARALGTTVHEMLAEGVAAKSRAPGRGDWTVEQLEAHAKHAASRAWDASSKVDRARSELQSATEAMSAAKERHTRAQLLLQYAQRDRQELEMIAEEWRLRAREAQYEAELQTGDSSES